MGLVIEKRGIGNPDDWCERHRRWHDRNVVSRGRRELMDAFSRHFDIQDASVDKLSFHLRRRLSNLAVVRFLEARRHGTTLLMTRP